MARIHNMPVNMDYMRLHMNKSLNSLGTEMVNIIDVYVPGYEREKIMSAFNDLVQYVDMLNCIYMPNDAHFNNVSHKVSVIDIYKAIDALD